MAIFSLKSKEQILWVLWAVDATQLLLFCFSLIEIESHYVSGCPKYLYEVWQQVWPSTLPLKAKV